MNDAVFVQALHRLRRGNEQFHPLAESEIVLRAMQCQIQARDKVGHEVQAVVVDAVVEHGRHRGQAKL